MPPDDQSSVHLPEAVRRQVERANELAREAGVANVPPAPVDNSEGTENSPENRTVLTPSDGGQNPPTEAPPAPVEETPAPPPQEADWQQRYNTLQGKYNAEVPDLRAQLREQQERIDRLQQQLIAPPPPPPASAPAPRARDIPADDVDTYGQDLIHATQRWAEAKFGPMLEDYEQRLMRVEGGNLRLQEQNAGQRIEAALARSVPDWEQINVDPNFLSWLAQRDPFSGQVRRDLLAEAYGSGDGARTVAFFQAFKNEHTAVSPRAGTQTVHTDADAPADRLPLDALAVPGRSSLASSPQLGAPEKRIWRTGEITQFYDQKRRGLWDHRRDDADRIEADIVAAGVEGRVR